MNWERFFGSKLYRKLKEFCESRNMTMAAAIRCAVAAYFSKREVR